MTEADSTRPASRRILPEMMREKSSRSPINWFCDSALRSMATIARAAVGSSRLPVRTIRAQNYVKRIVAGEQGLRVSIFERWYRRGTLPRGHLNTSVGRRIVCPTYSTTSGGIWHESAIGNSRNTITKQD